MLKRPTVPSPAGFLWRPASACSIAGPWLFILGLIGLNRYQGGDSLIFVVVGILLFLLGFVFLFGFMAIAPNQARVLLLFGNVQGVGAGVGLLLGQPVLLQEEDLAAHPQLRDRLDPRARSRRTPRARCSQTSSRTAGRPSKVNDRDGNPIDISAVVVWRVVNTAEALFEVDDYEDFVAVQSEAALRNLASRHPYDSEDHEVSLRGSTSEISDQLKRRHPGAAGQGGRRGDRGADQPSGLRARRSRPPCCSASRPRPSSPRGRKIVDGAVGMVQMALDHLAEENIVELDDERRAAMVSNLLVVLCSDRHTQPVVNTGIPLH